MELSQALQIQQLIDTNRQAEARQALNSLGTPDLRDPLMWALAAQLAPSAETRENALRKTFENSDSVALADWALGEIDLLAKQGAARPVGRPPLAQAAETPSGSGGSSLALLFSLPMVQAGLAGLALGVIGLVVLSLGPWAGGGLVQTTVLTLLKVSCVILLLVGVIGIAAGAINTFTQGRPGSK